MVGLTETKRGFSLVRRRVRCGNTTAVFKVDNIDRYLAKAKEMGGRIVERKHPIGGGFGYFGAFRESVVQHDRTLGQPLILHTK